MIELPSDGWGTAARRARFIELTALAFGGGDRLERLRVMEELRCVLAAAQAVEVATLAADRRAAIAVEIATVPRPGVGSQRRRDEAERRMVAEVGAARRISPYQAGRFVSWACAAPTDTPRTFALLATGALSERRAMTVHQLASVLPAADRVRVDAQSAPDRADPVGTCERAAYAENQRRVTTRPAPDTMAWLTALAPTPQIIACRAALERVVKEAVAAGDPRSRGQVMADTLVQRITGQATGAAVPVAIQLVITDRTLLGGDTPPGSPTARPAPRRWPATSPSTPRRPAPSAGCSPIPQASSSPRRPAPGSSAPPWPTSSGSATAPARHPGAMPRS